jgi:hypothetical protein
MISFVLIFNIHIDPSENKYIKGILLILNPSHNTY